MDSTTLTAGSPTSRSLPAASEDHGRMPGCVFQAGEAVSYRIKVSSVSVLDTKGLPLPPGTSTQMAQTTSAELDLKALAATEAGATVLLARYRNPQSTQLQRVDELSAPFLLRVSDKCNISGFARRRGTPLAYARVQQALAYELMFRWSEPATGRHEHTAQNALGEYVSVVASTEDRGGRLVQRRILSYNEFWAEDVGLETGLDAVPAESLVSVRIGPGPWFESLTGREMLRGGASRAENTVEVKRVAAVPEALARASQSRRDYRWENLLPQRLRLREQARMTESERKALAIARGQTLDVSLAGYLARVQSGVGIADTWPGLRTFLEARPEMTGELVERLQRGEIPDAAQAGVYIALGNARTAEAREALDGIMRDSAAPPFERTRAMFSMVDRDDVGVELAEYLSAQTPAVGEGASAGERFFGREATLALGAMAGLQKDPAVSAVAVATVSSMLASHTRPNALRPAFALLSGIGDPGLLDLARPAVESPDPEVREAAAISIRAMRPSETGAFASEWLAHEDDWNVKRKLYQAIHKQILDTHEPVTDALLGMAIRDLTSQPDVSSRRALIHIVGRSAATSPAARAALKRQVPIEARERSGLYGAIATFLGPRDVREALSE